METMHNNHQNGGAAANAWGMPPEATSIPLGEIMSNISDALQQGQIDTADIAAALAAQPGLAECLAGGLNHLAQALLLKERAQHLAAHPG